MINPYAQSFMIAARTENRAELRPLPGPYRKPVRRFRFLSRLRGGSTK